LALPAWVFLPQSDLRLDEMEIIPLDVLESRVALHKTEAVLTGTCRPPSRFVRRRRDALQSFPSLRACKIRVLCCVVVACACCIRIMRLMINHDTFDFLLSEVLSTRPLAASVMGCFAARPNTHAPLH